MSEQLNQILKFFNNPLRKFRHVSNSQQLAESDIHPIFLVVDEQLQIKQTTQLISKAIERKDTKQIKKYLKKHFKNPNYIDIFLNCYLQRRIIKSLRQIEQAKNNCFMTNVAQFNEKTLTVISKLIEIHINECNEIITIHNFHLLKICNILITQK